MARKDLEDFPEGVILGIHACRLQWYALKKDENSSMVQNWDDKSTDKMYPYSKAINI